MLSPSANESTTSINHCDEPDRRTVGGCLVARQIGRYDQSKTVIFFDDFPGDHSMWRDDIRKKADEHFLLDTKYQSWQII